MADEPIDGYGRCGICGHANGRHNELSYCQASRTREGFTHFCLCDGTNRYAEDETVVASRIRLLGC